MALSRLGDFLELVDDKNSDDEFDYRSLRGISINKILIPTKATGTENLNLKGYKIVRKGQFTYCTVTSRNGNKISLAYNDDVDCIVSSINPVFKIKDEQKLLPRYLMMYFNRAEFDRYARFNSWGSARETFTWEDLCDIEIEIPTINIQKKYVEIYEGLLANLKSYEKGLEDLKLVCDGFIEDLRRKHGTRPLKGLIVEYNEKNVDSKITVERGIGTNKCLIIPKAVATDISKQKILYKGTFGFATNTARNGEKLSIAINSEVDCIISTSYCTFRTVDSLLPEYLNIWVRRTEFDRYVRYNSWGSVREMFYFEDMEAVEIALPDLETQSMIVNILNEYESRKKYANELKQKISNICPILIRGAVKEAKGGN